MKTFKLDSGPKVKSGFTTPEQYFDNFSEKVMQQLPENEPKIISVFSKSKTWLYAVAAVLVIALAVPLYFSLNTQSSDIDDETIENYITYQSNVSNADLVNLLDEEDIQKMSVEMNIEDLSIENELSGNNNLELYILN